MFIRKTRILNRETKKHYSNFQLVESYRTDRGPRQRILLNLGADLALDQKECKALANRIEEILKGIISFLPFQDKIEQLAQRYASQLIHRMSTSTSSAVTEVGEEPMYQPIDINTIEQQEPRTVGVEHLLLHFASELQIQKKLQVLGLSKKEIALSLGTIIGRAVFPASERATHEWLTQRSGLGELIAFDFHNASLNNLYHISDVLLAHKSELEKHLESAQKTVHGYNSTMVLYDLTNTYMEGQAKGNAKAKHGFSKEKRSDCPLVTLGLVINEHGFPIRSSFLPGNISEPKTLQEAVETLYDPSDLFKPTVILDAGIASQDNLEWLRKHGFNYIVSARQNAPLMELIGPLVPVGDPEKTCVKAALVKSDSSEERWLYCESEAKRIVATQMKEAFQKRFESDLIKLKEGLAKPKGRKKYVKIIERIGRLKEKHSRVSGCYDINVEVSGDNQTATAVQWTLKPEKLEEKLNGHYFLRTNLLHLGPEALWALYDSIRTVEDAFRFMKSALGMRPVHHQREHRVDGHLWITILAYHLIQACLYQLRQSGISCQWETVRNCLSNRLRITMRANTAEEKILYHRSTTKVEEQQRRVYQALGMTTQILKAKKTLA